MIAAGLESNRGKIENPNIAELRALILEAFPELDVKYAKVLHKYNCDAKYLEDRAKKIIKKQSHTAWFRTILLEAKQSDAAQEFLRSIDFKNERNIESFSKLQISVVSWIVEALSSGIKS